MNNREVAHAWANQTRESAKGSHFFFEGRAIYSYGYHFKIAEHVSGKPGHIFFTRRTYGPSTAKHLNYTHAAIGAHLKTWMVISFEDHAENVADYLADMEEARTRALKARTNAEMYRESAERAAIAAGEYAQAFGAGGNRALKIKAFKFSELARSGGLFNPEELAGVRERVAAAKEAARAQAQKREATIAERYQEDLAKLAEWVAGTRGSVPSNYNLPTRLRLEGRIDDDLIDVATSRGARVSARRAALLWDALCNSRDVIGLSVDGYIIRSWDGRVLVAGCHTIEAAELARIAGLLGLPGTLPGVVEVAS